MRGPRAGRTQQCSDEQARTRLEHARKFLDVAEVLSGEADREYAGVAAAVAVLAGIAASDASCCRALRRRSRGSDHHEAEDLMRQIEPGGQTAANALRRLLNLKDEAHYGLFDVSGVDLRTAIRQARTLIDFANSVFRR